MKIRIGGIPGFLIDLIVGIAKRIVIGKFNEMQPHLKAKANEIILEQMQKVPDHLAIGDTPFSVVLGWPEAPKVRVDRFDIPFDGTIFLTRDGPNKTAEAMMTMPYWNEADPNNIQLHLD